MRARRGAGAVRIDHHAADRILTSRGPFFSPTAARRVMIVAALMVAVSSGSAMAAQS